MPETSDEKKSEDALRYVTGCMSPNEASAFEAQAKVDEDLAAEITVARFMATTFLPPVKRSDKRETAPPPRSRKWFVPSALVASVIIALTAVIVLTHLYSTQSAVLADTKNSLDQANAKLEETRQSKRLENFDSEWLDPRKWKTARRKTTAQDGYARLNDRGSLVTVDEFKSPMEIHLGWRWIDIAGDISYRDTLTVSLHTSGEHAKKHSFEILDGITITFQAHAGRVSVVDCATRKELGATKEGLLPMPAGKWHQIRLIDDGKTISVFFSGPAIDKATKDQPVLTVPYTGDFKKHHIAVYNREVVAGALHESHIDRFSVHPIQAPKKPKE